MQALVERAIAAFGRIDVMVCNAGIGYHGPFEATPAPVMRRLVDVNLLGTLYAAQAALVAMRRQGHGHIIAISSIVGRRGIGGSAAYSATKAAQVGLIEGLRAECHGTAIHASVVLPVSTMTEFHAAMARTFGHAGTGRGPQQSADQVARAIVRCIVSPRAGGLSVQAGAVAVDPHGARADIDGPPGTRFQTASGGAGRCARSA